MTIPIARQIAQEAEHAIPERWQAKDDPRRHKGDQDA
jgi:hypothetical protein